MSSSIFHSQASCSKSCLKGSPYMVDQTQKMQNGQTKDSSWFGRHVWQQSSRQDQDHLILRRGQVSIYLVWPTLRLKGVQHQLRTKIKTIPRFDRDHLRVPGMHSSQTSPPCQEIAKA